MPWLPSLRATVLISVMLVGAYGTDAGLAATALLLMTYALAAGVQIGIRNMWKWLRNTKKRVRAVKLLDDRKMKVFQKVTLQIFDLPHHPRRLRQAVRRWREWRENSDFFRASDGIGGDKTRGDGLGNLHDMTSSLNGVSPRLGFGGIDDSSNPSNPNEAYLSENFSAARTALSLCDLVRQLPPEVVKQLAQEHMREVHITKGEDVFRGRVRDDELAVLVSGSVAVGEFINTYTNDGLTSVEQNFFRGGGATGGTQPGVALNSLLDVLEGSEHAHESIVSVKPAESPKRSMGGVGQKNIDDPSLDPFGDDQLVSAAADAAAAASKAAAEAANELANESLLDSFKPVESVVASPPQGLSVRIVPVVNDTHPVNPSTLGVGVDLGLAAVASLAADEDDVNGDVDFAVSNEADDAASTVADAAFDDDRSNSQAPSHSYPNTPTRMRSQVEVGAHDSVSHPGTPGRPGTPNRVGRAGSKGGSGFGAAQFSNPQVSASDFSGGPGGLPRLRARGGEGGCVIAAVPLRAFHRAAGFQLGIQAPTMRLCGGYHALCHYLRAPSELGALWVDPAPTSTPSSSAGATLALVRLLGAEAARAVDRTSLETLLERRGYRPRRAPDSWRDADRGGDSDGELGSGGSHNMDDDQTSSRASSSRLEGFGAQHGRQSRTTVGSGSVAQKHNETQSQPVSAANSARGGAPVELEAVELAPGERLRFRSTAAAALLVERGTLEGYWTPPDARDADDLSTTGRSQESQRGTDSHRSSSRNSRASSKRSGKLSGGSSFQRDGRDLNFSDRNSSHARPAFVAHPGSTVGEFLLLTGQRAAVKIRAGPDGAVVAALPHSAVARLVRTYPATYARVATRIARRLRPALPARAWDRCGVQWISLGAGQTLADHANARRRALGVPGSKPNSVFSATARGSGVDIASGSLAEHPDGVYVVVTGCVRLAADDNLARNGRGGSGNGSGRNGRPSPNDVDFNSGGAGTSGSSHDELINQQKPRFLGPGDAVGEDVILHDAFGGGEDDSLDEFSNGRSSHSTSCSSSRRERSRATAAALGRARAVRESQLLWIPASGLEALATSAPRAFAALAWRMGQRAGGASKRQVGHMNARRSGGLDGTGFGVDDGDSHPGVAKSGSGASMFGAGRNPGVDLDADAPNAPRTVAVVPVSEGAALALDEFCSATLAALSKSCAARVADSASRLAEVGQAGVGPLAHEATAHWLAQLESANDVVLLKADPFPSPWCVQCARHADTILLVAASEDTPPTPEEGRTLQARLLGGGPNGGGSSGLAQRELVVLHGSAEIAPTGTRAWLEAFSVHRHHHLARAPAHGLAPAHASRLARSLRRHSVGLVLAGGGARGFAHVGVLMALEEEGVPVDMLGGTSMGSFVGGIYAKEPTALLTRIIARRLAVHMSSAWEQLLDLTVPVVSYFSGFRMNRALEPLFRGAKIEDCWLPFFCVTLDLISCVTIVHRNGTLWRYVRASMALVGFLPPVCDQKPIGKGKGDGSHSNKSSQMHVLVDGGYVNNLPTDVMRAAGARIVIAVDVSGRGLPETQMKPWGDAISGISILVRNWLPRFLGGGPTCPTMAQMQSHLPFVTDYANAARRVGTVDIMVRPAVADVPILAFGRYAEVVRAGHEAGLRAVRAWKLANPDAAPLLDDGMWRPAWGASGGGLQGSGGSGDQGAVKSGSRRRKGVSGGLSSAEHLEKMNRGYQRPSGRPASHLRSARKNDDSDVSDGESDVDEKQSKQATSKSPGFSDWFKRKDKKSDADADDAESPKSRTEAWVQDPLMSRDETLGFFSPDQPKPNLRQRHRYNSFQSGLDGDQYHRQH